VRLVALDSTKPGHDAGEVDEYRLEWLDRELSDAPEQCTLLAMHHSPLVTGEAAWDRIGLPTGEREALGWVLNRHRQVQLVVGGHLHRTIVSRLAGRTVLAAPAVYGGSVPDFGSDQLKIVRTAPAFVVHALAEGELTSHVLRAE
jgi:3',5'-cyclic AMP phosphodiesterase CpdA